MPKQKEIKIEINGFTVIVKDKTYTIEKEGVRIDGDVEELSRPQITWLENTSACMVSFINSLNFDGSAGI